MRIYFDQAVGSVVDAAAEAKAFSVAVHSIVYFEEVVVAVKVALIVVVVFLVRCV